MVNPVDLQRYVGHWVICRTTRSTYAGRLLRTHPDHILMHCPSGPCVSYLCSAPSVLSAHDAGSGLLPENTDIALAFSPSKGYPAIGYGSMPYGYRGNGSGLGNLLIPLAAIVGLTLVGLRW